MWDTCFDRNYLPFKIQTNRPRLRKYLFNHLGFHQMIVVEQLIADALRMFDLRGKNEEGKKELESGSHFH